MLGDDEKGILLSAVNVFLQIKGHGRILVTHGLFLLCARQGVIFDETPLQRKRFASKGPDSLR